MRAAVGLLLLTLPIFGADWIRLRTPTAELLTDAGESSGRAVLARLAQMRGMLPGSQSTAVRVFLFSSEREFRDYIDGRATEGLFQSGPDRDYILMHAGFPFGRVAAHEYIHLLLNHGSAPLPLWFEEGTAEFYSTLDARGSRVVVGAPIPEHRQTLDAQRWLTAAELTDATAALYDERARAGMFYAESWAVVHMLNLAPGYRDHMPQFAELLANGTSSADAFPAAFGKTLDQALDDLKPYLRRMTLATVDGSAASAGPAPTAEKLRDEEALALRADVALRSGKLETARKLYTQAAKLHPDWAEVEAGLGLLAIADRDRAAARRHLERALSLGSRDGSTWFEYALFERESGAPRERVDQLLKKAVEINPDFAEAQFMLGVRATDDGRLEEAVGYLEKAVRSLPRQSTFWHALAFALEKQDHRDQAREAARQALHTAANSQEEQMAQALYDSLLDR